MKFKIRPDMTYLLRESGRTWNRAEDLQAEYEQHPTDEARERLEQSALEWFEASARAGRAVMRQRIGDRSS